jgi:hypothetical protein
MKTKRNIYLATRIYSQAMAWFIILAVIYALINPLNNIVGMSLLKLGFVEWLFILSVVIMLFPYKLNEIKSFYILRLSVCILFFIMMCYGIYKNFNGSFIHILYGIPVILYALSSPISLIYYKQWRLHFKKESR